jgi:hypothetical protein
MPGHDTARSGWESRVSETDSFIDEVTEEVRRDKLFATFRKYGWIGGVFVVLIVGGAAFSEWRKSKADAAAQGFGDAIVSALDTSDAAARVAALDAIKAGGAQGDPAARQAVLAILAADEALRAGDSDEARARLSDVAANAGLDPAYRDMAQLKLLSLPGDKTDPAERDRLLADLAQPGRPYRVLAVEQQALGLVAAGKRDEALSALTALLQDADAPAGLRRRVSQLIVALGGKLDAA